MQERKIIYYIASSIDGYITGPNEDVSGFISEGGGVEKYMQELEAFDTVIMGRNTYEFGYKYGLDPGLPAYPSMAHYIFSNTLKFENPDEQVQVKPLKLEEVRKIRQQPGTDIYLCGGGKFAGWLLDHQQIDILKVKLNPLILGQGIKLFGDSKKLFKTELIDIQSYDDGMQVITYKIKY